MKLGVFGLNSKVGVSPAVVRPLVDLCESLGFESWWAGEHVVLPSPRVAPAPMDPEDAILDPLIHLAYVAAVSTTLLLGTGIIILPQRNPLVLAKQVASLDALSGGRLLLGIGAGYLEPELHAIGVPMAERGSRTDDHLGAMRAIWYDPAPVTFTGIHTDFAGIDAHPRPARSIPIVIGGHSPSAYRRAVEQGHGWYGFHCSPEQAAGCIAGLATAITDHGRPGDLGPLEISITPSRPLTADSVRAYRDAGVHRLIVNPLPVEDPAAIAAFLTEQAAVVDSAR
ncbi:MAG: TIGR03619 family F420-dependent LLM class oxidoreductase [Ilumatobacteraceae bacterium]